MNIGDLVLQLIADGSKLTPSVEKEAAKAGDAGAKTLSAKMATSLRTNGVRVFGAAAAGAFAVATKGALELEDAVARIRSETGASAEESEQIAKSANRIAGDQQETLAVVSDVAIAVRKNLGATGEELDKLTEATVKYARVTKQDAVAAVADMDDIVDAYGLSLAGVTKVQDQLVVSNQKYGGSITDNQKALAAMAPQLKALNLDYNDGIELLNLFAASGLEAADGQKALNSAIQKLPPGETLDQFIKRLSQVQDDGDRARLAIEVFGSKAGAKLANAIKPGITSLDEFGVSATDAAGAVDASVDSLDSSLRGRLRKALSQAQAAIRGFGADFGPALTGAASLATLATSLGLRLPTGPLKALGVKIAGAIGLGIASDAGQAVIGNAVADAATGATSSSRLGAAATRLGQFLGTGIGKAAGAAFGAAFLVFAVGPELQKGANDFLGLDESADQDARNKEILRRWDAAMAKNVEQTVAHGEAQAAFDHAGQELITSLGEGVQKAVGPMGQQIPADIARALDWRNLNAGTKAAGNRAAGAMAQGITDARSKPVDAFSQLVEMLKHPLSRAKEVARLIGQLTGDQLAKGLKSKDPAIRAQADYSKQLIIDRLVELRNQSAPLGAKAAEQLRKGLKSKDPDIRAAAEALAKRVPNAVRGESGPTATAANNLGARAARSLKAGFGHPILTADIHIRGDANDRGRAAGGPVMAGVPYLVNEDTPRSEVFVPSTSGHMLNRAQAVEGLQAAFGQGAAGSGDTTTTNFTVNVYPGSDVSPAAAERFGQAVLREVAGGFRQGGARLGVTTSVRP